jgi:hypothetical protein
MGTAVNAGHQPVYSVTAIFQVSAWQPKVENDRRVVSRGPTLSLVT